MAEAPTVPIKRRSVDHLGGAKGNPTKSATKRTRANEHAGDIRHHDVRRPNASATAVQQHNRQHVYSCTLYTHDNLSSMLKIASKNSVD